MCIKKKTNTRNKRFVPLIVLSNGRPKCALFVAPHTLSINTHSYQKTVPINVKSIKWLSSFCYDCSLLHHPCKNFHRLIKWHNLWINKHRPLAFIHYRFFALLSCDTLCFKLLIFYNLITFWGNSQRTNCVYW